MVFKKQQRWEAGDPAPRFAARSSNSPSFKFDTIAGRYVVLTFFGSAAIEKNLQALRHIFSRNDVINDELASFFGVSIDPTDESGGRIKQMIPGFRFFWDFDKNVSVLYGAIPGRNVERDAGDGTLYQPFTLILDPMLRVMAMIPLADAEEHNRQFDDCISRLPDVNLYAGVPTHAPVLVLPRVFEPEFCRELIALYEANGGQDSGFMREIDGKTVAILDHKIKRRDDFYLDQDKEHAGVCAAARERIKQRLIPEVQRAFQFKITRMERYVVSRYESDTGGFFSAHRDNTTRGTAHRRFACSINLNAEEYEGGDLRFAEFGQKTYRAPTGGAVIFSCSLLHEATSVTHGTRYAFLPFFYDDAAAKIREQNLPALSGRVIDKNKGADEFTPQDASPFSGGESSLL